MGRRYRIRIYAKPRENPDPAMLAQVVVLLARQLQRQQQQHGKEHQHHQGKNVRRSRSGRA